MDKNQWIDLNNVYIPPHNSTGQDISFRPEIIPTSKNSITCGDFNAHSMMWDQLQPEDARGGEVEDWVVNNEQKVLNDGTRTRVNRATGNWSTPDIVLAGAKVSGKCSWEVQEGLGGSDHSPMLITIK